MSEPIEAESAAEFIELGRLDWYETMTGKRLHAAEIDERYWAEIKEFYAVLSPVRLACGLVATDGLIIPGMFARMGAMRCNGCCRATGLPPGKGSPKNDPACRQIIGLDA